MSSISSSSYDSDSDNRKFRRTMGQYRLNRLMDQYWKTYPRRPDEPVDLKDELAVELFQDLGDYNEEDEDDMSFSYVKGFLHQARGGFSSSDSSDEDE